MATIARFFHINILAALTATCSIAALAGGPGDDRIAEARRLLVQEAKGDYAAVAARVDPNSKRVLSQGTLRTRWTGIVRRAGPLKSVGAGKQQKVNQYDMVVLTCQFAKGDVDAKITFNSNDQIVSFFFVPSPGSKLPPERGGRSGPPRGAGGPGGPPPHG